MTTTTTHTPTATDHLDVLVAMLSDENGHALDGLVRGLITDVTIDPATSLHSYALDIELDTANDGRPLVAISGSSWGDHASTLQGNHTGKVVADRLTAAFGDRIVIAWYEVDPAEHE